MAKMKNVFVGLCRQLSPGLRARFNAPRALRSSAAMEELGEVKSQRWLQRTGGILQLLSFETDGKPGSI